MCRLSVDWGDESSPCAIHARWLTLLRRYADEELSSHDYVEAVLNLLRAYKHQLRGERNPPTVAVAASGPMSDLG